MRHNNSTPIDRARRGLGIDSRRVGCLYIHSSANADGSGLGPLNPSVPADSRSSRTRAADHGPNHFFMARPAPFLPSEMKRLTELSAEGRGGLSVDRFRLYLHDRSTLEHPTRPLLSWLCPSHRLVV